jgi:hypothetical protein
MNIKEILGPDEKVVLEVDQRRLLKGGKLITPAKILVTTERIVWQQDVRWLGLKKDYVDYHYADLANVRMHKGVFSSDLIISSRFGERYIIPGVPNNDAKQVERVVSDGIRRYSFGAGRQREYLARGMRGGYYG